jgi:hypothetical protein
MILLTLMNRQPKPRRNAEQHQNQWILHQIIRISKIKRIQICPLVRVTEFFHKAET